MSTHLDELVVIEKWLATCVSQIQDGRNKGLLPVGPAGWGFLPAYNVVEAERWVELARKAGKRARTPKMGAPRKR